MAIVEAFCTDVSQGRVSEIVAQIRKEGYVILPGALTAEYVELIGRETGDLHPELNVNAINPVYFNHQRFLTQCLAKSRAVFDLMTSGFCFAVMTEYFGSGFRLTDQRVYVTEKNEHMQWHVDNKADDSIQSEFTGIIFIFYLCDVADGELQLIRGSNSWSGRQKSADFTDRFIDANYKNDIVSVKSAAGTCVIYDTTVVHRAHKIRSNWERKSLFFQVEKRESGGEPVLVDTRFLGNLTGEQRYFLGFGAEPEYKVFPQSSRNTIRFGVLARLIFLSGGSLGIAMLRAALSKLDPDRKAKLKKLLGRGA